MPSAIGATVPIASLDKVFDLYINISVSFLIDILSYIIQHTKRPKKASALTKHRKWLADLQKTKDELEAKYINDIVAKEEEKLQVCINSNSYLALLLCGSDSEVIICLLFSFKSVKPNSGKKLLQCCIKKIQKHLLRVTHLKPQSRK